jgi:type VI secretion system secreted protein VgrG
MPTPRTAPRIRHFAALASVALAAATFLGTSPASAAQPPVGLGTAESFAVLAGSGITNTGPTTVTGDVGTFPTPTMTGFASVTLDGTNHAGDAVTQGAKSDLVDAYNDAAGRNPVTNVPVELGGTTKLAGVYVSPTLGLTGTLTLDAKGDPDATFVFKASSTLITATNSRVLLLNGANPCRVVWQVGSSATFGTGTRFVGDVLAYTSISAKTSATFRGRLLARNGAVTLDTNTITNDTCVAPTGGSGGTTTTVPATGGNEDDTTTDSDDSTVGGTPGSSGGTTGGTPTTTPPTAEVSRSTPIPSYGPPFGPPNPPRAATPTESPGRPLLPYTGVEIAGTIAVALALLGFGTLIVTTTRRNRRQLHAAV